MNQINWDDFRFADGTIDLICAYSYVVGNFPSPQAIQMVFTINELQPIRSRQAAATILIMMRDKS